MESEPANKLRAITAYAYIRNQQLFANGKLLYQNAEAKPADFLLQSYEHLPCAYPKFYKMDNLSKTAFLAVEALLLEKNLDDDYPLEDRAVIVSCANSSTDTDMRYAETIHNIPSPALFVYTLPNIMVGELSIRHRLKGESACFISDIFDLSFQTDYINTLFDSAKAKVCIAGWADYFNGKAEAFFYLVEAMETTPEKQHTFIHVSKLYTELWTN